MPLLYLHQDCVVLQPFLVSRPVSETNQHPSQECIDLLKTLFHPLRQIPTPFFHPYVLPRRKNEPVRYLWSCSPCAACVLSSLTPELRCCPSQVFAKNVRLALLFYQENYHQLRLFPKIKKGEFSV